MEEVEDQKPLVSSMETVWESSAPLEDPAFSEVRVKSEPVEEDDAYSSALHPGSSEPRLHVGEKRRASSNMPSPVKQRKVDRRDTVVKEEVAKEEEEEEEEEKEEEEEEEVADSLVALRGEGFIVKMDPDFCNEEAAEADASKDVLRDDNASTTVTNTFRQSPIQTSHQSLVGCLVNMVKNEHETSTYSVHSRSEHRAESAGDESRGAGAGLGQIPQLTSTQGSGSHATENICSHLPWNGPISVPYVGAVTAQGLAGVHVSHDAAESGAGETLQATGMQVPSQITVLVQRRPILQKPAETEKVFTCEACSRELWSQASLERHIRVFHPEHICSECDLFFPEHGTRTLHVDITHKGKSCGDNLFYLRAMKLQARSPASQGKHQPADQRSTQPVTQKSTQPTSQRSTLPTNQKNSQPTNQKNSQPTNQKSTRPTNRKSTQLTNQKSTRPTNEKSTRLSSQKSTQPTSQKSNLPTTPRSNPSSAQRSCRQASQGKASGSNCSSSASNTDDLPDDAVRELIRLFQSHSSLFDPANEAFHDRQKTREAIKSISVHMGRNWSIEATRQKLRWLRNTYTQCRAAVEQARREGAALEDVSKITWKWYHLLDPFLGKVHGTTMKVVSSLQHSSKTQSPEESHQSRSTLDEEDTGPDSLLAEDEDDDPNSGHVLIADIIRRNQQALQEEEPSSTHHAGHSVQPSQEMPPHHPLPTPVPFH